MIKLNGFIVTPTIFPDQSSQVWKINELNFRCNDNVIRWEFEHEGEFMQLAQLKQLITMKYGTSAFTVLELPYLPYARQDKEITNQSTFALYTFAPLLNSLYFDSVIVIDPHNIELTKYLIDRVDVRGVDILPILRKLKALPVYPDAGAAKRYHASPKALRCEKVREPLTGAITGVRVIGKVQKKAYLIQDDICDGGKTFIEVAKKLYLLGAKDVHLYVSHGIFSKGLQVLRDAGIKRIFTYKGEII